MTNDFWLESNRATIDPQVEFPKVEKMLCDLAWRVAKVCPVTFEECRSEAYVAFMLACRTYDGTRGSKFSSWCYFKVWTSLRSWITKRTRDPLIFNAAMDTDALVNDELIGFATGWAARRLSDGVMPTTVDVVAPAQRSEVMDIVEDLSQDAQEIIRLLVETPAEILDLGKIATGPRRGEMLDLGIKMSPKQLLARVKEYLRARGRDKRRIERAQREIELRFWEVWAH